MYMNFESSNFDKRRLLIYLTGRILNSLRTIITLFIYHRKIFISLLHNIPKENQFKTNKQASFSDGFQNKIIKIMHSLKVKH